MRCKYKTNRKKNMSVPFRIINALFVFHRRSASYFRSSTFDFDSNLGRLDIQINRVPPQNRFQIHYLPPYMNFNLQLMRPFLKDGMHTQSHEKAKFKTLAYLTFFKDSNVNLKPFLKDVMQTQASKRNPRSFTLLSLHA